jgi:uncharacterized membrane protein
LPSTKEVAAELETGSVVGPRIDQQPLGRHPVDHYQTPEESSLARIEHTVEVDCTVGTVWAIWSDVRRLPEFSQVTTAVRDAPSHLTEVGQSFVQDVRVGGRSRSVEWRVTSLQAEEQLTIESAPAPGIHVVLIERVRPLPNDRTELQMAISYRLPFGPLGHLAGKLGLEQIADREAKTVLDGVARLALDVRPASEPR